MSSKTLSPRDMDGFLPLLSTTDTKNKMTIANNLIAYLDNPDNSIECTDIGQFIDNLIPWMQSSNYKVSQNGIEAMTSLVDKMGHDFRPYIQTVLPPIIDRLGDSKELVREQSQLLILKLLEREVISPQTLFDKLTPAFSHKNGKIREEVMNCLLKTLVDYGVHCIAVSRLVPAIVKLLSDPISPVRDTAFNTLVELYKMVGERLRMDLQKKHNVPQSKLPTLMAKFDEIRENGELLPSATNGSQDNGSHDEYDGAIRSVTKQRANSVPRKGSYSASKAQPVQSTPPTSAAKPFRLGVGSLRRQPSNAGSTAGPAGAVDEEMFSRAFEDVPTVQLFSGRELDDQLNTIKDIIGDATKDWSKRADALKKVRSLMIAGAAGFDELLAHLRVLEPAFQTSVRDLRSQVVREACYTIAYLSEQLGPKLDHFAEFLLPSIINLIQNSAKIMASAGVVTVRYILRYTHAPRLIPIIATNMSSKSKEIRRACCEFLEQLLSSWSTHSLERHIALLQDAIKKGISDADNDARVLARKAYWSYRSHFPEQAESLLNSLDATYKRALNGEALSNSSSTNSLNTQGISSRYGTTTPRMPRQTSSATDGYSSLRRGSPSGISLRSNSAIDLQAAQRAKARAQYAAMSRLKIGSGASLPRAKKSPEVSNHTISPERVGRTRGRVAGVSQSQPSSRSGSPSSRLSYATYASARGDSTDSPSPLQRPRRLSSGIPRSTGTSRETSPSRHQDRVAFGSKLRRPPPSSPRPVMAAKILQQSREAESALADALFDGVDGVSVDLIRAANSRKTSSSSFRTYEDHSDESETSSVCSERSMDSFRRPSDSYSWSGSQQRLYREILEPNCKDIVEIINNVASQHWADRKEGLVGLQNYFQNGNLLTGTELKKVTESFTKMFMDTHTKVFSLFLDALNELIQSHKADLNDWLYILLTRLLNKLGSDLLGSIQTKIQKSLNVVRESFPHELILAAVLRFIVDPTQTPNAKVKVATMTFLAQLTTEMDPSLVSSSHGAMTSAMSRVIAWTADQKSAELRKAASNAVIALFNLNTPQVTMLLAALPKHQQECASSLVQNHLDRNGGSTPSSPSAGNHHHGHHPASGHPPHAPMSPHRFMQSPGTPNHLEDHFSPEEVYRSLRRTTAEIQNYSFDGNGSGRLVDRDTTSQDSGISQMSAPGDKLDTLTERMEDLAINNSGRTSSLSSPTHRHREYTAIDASDYTDSAEDGYVPVATTNAEIMELLRKCVRTLEGTNDSEAPFKEKKLALNLLQHLVRDSPSTLIVENIRTILRVLLSQLDKPEPAIRSLVWVVMTEMFKKQGLEGSFSNFAELLMLKVLESHNDSDKEVTRTVEVCSATMGMMFAPEVVIRVVKPLIKTGDYPVNQGAIKMLTKVIEQKPIGALEPHLGELMTGLIEAYDHKQSPVRKCAVFCLVALHTYLGEEKMAPFLKNLNSSKLKLLHLYIRRTEQGSSVPTSPKNAPP